MAKFNSSKKYLTADEFIEHCKEANVVSSLGALEAYEKAGLLSPIYRLTAPEEYVCAMFNHNLKRSNAPNAPFDVENKWLGITDLVNALSSYSFPPSSHFKFVLNNGHPLDHAYTGENPFLSMPSSADYRPWSNYKIVAGISEGFTMEEGTTEHYYAPWQIFVIEELNYMHTIEENYVVGERSGWGIFRKDIHATKLINYFESFQIVSNFRMQESLIWHDITFGLKKTVIEGTLNDQLRARTIEAARQEYEKIPHASWIDFIRKLVELYKDYLKKEKIRLSGELKSYITSTINMIVDATLKSLEEISADYDGRFKGLRHFCREKGIFIYPGELERIYPDELKQARTKAKQILANHLKQFNETLASNANIDESNNDDLIDNIVESGHMLLLSHIHEIEKLWFKRDLHWESSIWAHLRSFAVSIESIGQEWFNESKLGRILNRAFADYDNLKKAVGYKITDAESSIDFKDKFEIIMKCQEESCSKNICGHHLLIAHLTRNYVSHKIDLDADMSGSIFLEIYKSLVLTLISLFVMKIERTQ